MEAISKTELARRLKISKPRVSQLVRAGMPVLPDGKVDAAVALDWIARRTDPSHNIGRRQRGPAGPVVAPTPVGATTKFSGDAGAVLLVARAKKAIAAAKRAERLERHQAGELIEAEAVKQFVSQLCMMVRDHALAQADRGAPQVVGVRSQAEAHALLRKDARSMLERLSKAVASSGF